MGTFYSTLAMCLILIAHCNAAAVSKPLKFTKFCKAKEVKNGTHDRACERLLRHIYVNYIEEIKQDHSLSLADRLDAIENELVKDGCKDGASANTVCMVNQSFFDKSLTVDPMELSEIKDVDLQKGVKDTIYFLEKEPEARSASFIIGPSASGKSSITSTIAGGIKLMGVNTPIFTIDGDDFREGYEPYQKLIQMSRNFPCSFTNPNERCVFNFWKMPKFEKLKHKYIDGLWKRAKLVRAHLIIPETPKLSGSPIFKNIKHESFIKRHSYKPFIYRIEVTEEDQKFIMEKGKERGELSGKEYDKPNWFLSSVYRKPRLWPNTWWRKPTWNEFGSKFIKLKYKPKKPTMIDGPAGFSDAIPDEKIENTIERAAISDDLQEEEIYYDLPIFDDGRKH